MIFIAFFMFIALNVIALNMYNNSNLEEIEDYIKNENCKQIVYAKGSYKALCKDKILEIPNSFTVDIEKNSKEYKYSDIKNVDVHNLEIVVNDTYKIGFAQKEELYKFYKSLNTKINK